MNIKIMLDIGCLLLLTSVIMDAYFWFLFGYMIPSWTMAVMSGGEIILLQLLRKYII